MKTFPSVSGEVVLASVASRPRLATDVPGAVEYTGQSRAQLYNDMRTGLLPAYKNGARTILFFDDLDRYMHALPRAKFKPVDAGHQGGPHFHPRRSA
ncbi:MAG: helix-turn-helix domain-containing protein [Mesorhizobium sp.]|nr:MAG: helix-turn-helix domain-containing protein [Mesorhizobium sp.]